jgi:hypothetical protein
MDTVQGETQAIERLSRREPKSLAAFVVSLAQDGGPVGEQVRTFIAGDDVDQVSSSIKERIESIEGISEYDYRHRRGAEIGQRLGFILDAIETWVMPVDPRRAFELLVRFMERDAVAMQSCGEHDVEVSRAFKRAAALIGRTARSLPAAPVQAAVKALLADDAYGVRCPLGFIALR